MKLIHWLGIIVIVGLVFLLGIVSGLKAGYFQGTSAYYQSFQEGYKIGEDDASLKYKWNATSYQDGYDDGYDKGFKDFCCIRSNILFAGSTFTYDNKYVVKAWDITKNKVEIVIMRDGNEIDRRFCYPNRFCNINNISFQIDDIHIGKEASYLVFW